MFREHILKKDTLPCLRVESSSRKREKKSVRVKDLKGLPKKNLQAVQRVLERKRLSNRARKKDELQVSNKKNLHKVLEV